MSQDDRGNLPSGSRFERIVHCPGSNLLEAQFPEETKDPLADRGTRIHHAFQTGDTSGLDEEELADYEQGVKHLDMLVAQWQRDFGIEQVEERPREERYWIHHPQTMEALASGQVDRQFQGKDANGVMRLLIVDLKSGWAKHVQRSPTNWQLRVYGLALWEETGISNIRIAIDRAKNRAGFDDYADYTESDLKYSQQLFMMHLYAANQPDAPRYPGPHCWYCKGKVGCPQAAAYSMLPGVIAQRAAPDTRKIDEQVGMLADADLFRIWDASGIVGRVIDAVDARLKTFPPERLAELGLELPEQGSRNDKIANAKGAFEYLQTIQQMDPEKLWGLMQMNLGELRKMIQESKMLTDKGAKGWCEEFLREYMLFDHKAPSLRKLKIK